MPGFSLIYSSENLLNKEKIIIDSLKSLNILPGYSNTTFLFENNLFIGCNKYEHYPVCHFTEGPFDLFIEGKIYNKNNDLLKNELIEIITSLNNEAEEEEKYLREWLLNTDGDFIIYLINRQSKNIYIINDIFGRLPLYYKLTKNGFIASRYLKFITSLENDCSIDKTGIAQFLSLGFMLGNRTLFQNINHLKPASLVRISSSEISTKKLYDFDFSNRLNKNKTLKENVETLASLFEEGCKCRYSGTKENVVTLSGGLDSRMVASALYKNNIPFTAATIGYSNGHGHEEIKIAKDLSEIYNVDWKLIETPCPKGSDIYKLILEKEGMVSLATTPMLPFYKKISETFGENINFITGDNGDKIIFTYDKPVKKIKNIDQLIEYILNEHSLIGLSQVCSFLEINKKEMYDEIKSEIENYPEKDYNQKYIHFRVVEKPFKYAFQSEDRHRHYFWNTTPFWSFSFFYYMMNIPEKEKKRHKLFGELLKIFHPRAAEQPYSNFKTSITSVRGKILMNSIYYMYPYLPSGFIKNLKAIFFGGNPQIDHSHIVRKSIEEQLNSGHVKSVIKNIDLNIFSRRISIYNLLTITSALELLNGRVTIEKYFENEFD